MVLALGALVLRVAFLLGPGRGVGLGQGDAVEYDAFARLMLSGWHWFITPLAVREPLYPVLMAASYALPGSDLGMLKVVQVLLGAVTVAWVYLGLRVVTRESVALVTAVLVAINPHFIAYVAYPYRENLVIPLLTGFFFFAVHLARRFRRSLLLLCMLDLVLLIHTDTRFLPYILVLPVLMFAVNRSWRATFHAWGWSLILFLVLMTPYQVRGPVAFGRPVIVSSRVLDVWLPLLDARWSTSERGVGQEAGRTAWLRAWQAQKAESLAYLSREERAYLQAGGHPEIRRVQTYWDLFVEFWRFARFSMTYFPYPDGRVAPAWSVRHDISSMFVVIPFLVLFPFAWKGTPAEERRLLAAILVFLVAHTLIHVVVHARERYRIPAEVLTDTVIAIALVNLRDWRRRLARVSPAST